jgi:hypothetical protein
MPSASWVLSVALLLMLLDMGFERPRRERHQSSPAGGDAGEMHAFDGNNGQPPPPRKP